MSTTRRFEVGPTVGFRLPLGFSVEGDALFKREGLSLGQFGGFSGLSTHSDSWQFPVMLRFTAGHQPIAPVLGAGVSVRHINNFGDVPSYLFNSSTSANTVGFVAGGGVRFKVGPVDVTPEVRYTRWGGNSFSQSLLNFLPLNRNEASFLVGITF
jgi:opacity protein-like surface antigen